ncbi:hypothetical protein DM01DRAFT_1382555 [Hesseltinella vesiculosa]|uniref:Uncharacterized protein n=1 Tax=Hesseltinella vesiculosa TaxID=101127 RepID=A0A1X2GL04_9FUNG|nr:hypothetical protein DM01DRAFT_1382555 [Hesseltinella vesiculosa]
MPNRRIYHERKKSPVNAEDIDPYRVQKRSSLEPERQAHSRTASDSSTSRLIHPKSSSIQYDEDPYTATRGRLAARDPDVAQPAFVPETNDRANSYLPYSHHTMEQHVGQATAIYVEDDGLQLNPGSLLQDHFNIDLVSVPSEHRILAKNQAEKSMTDSNVAQAPPTIWRRRLFGLVLRNWLILLGLVSIAFTLLLFFLVPRIPKAARFEGINILETNWSNDSRMINGTWLLNITVNNEDNWIPLRLYEININVSDSDTGVVFATWNSPSPKVLRPRSLEPFHNIPLNVYYSSQNSQGDPTISDLFDACAMTTVSTVSPATTSSSTNIQLPLNITVHLEFHAIGAIKPGQIFMTPPRGINCQS